MKEIKLPKLLGDLSGNKDFEVLLFRFVPKDRLEKISLWQENDILKSMQGKAEGMAKTQAKNLRVLEREVNNLNKEGLKVSLKSKVQKNYQFQKRL